jgi:nucleoside-diphosphate-sugar epimerase
MNLLVTGGGGFLGQHLCRQLKEKGHQVWSLNRSTYPELQKLGINQIQADLTDGSAIKNYLKEKGVGFFEGFIHTAAKAGVWGTWEEYKAINTIATENLLEIAHELKVKYFLYTSSPSVVCDGGEIRGANESLEYPSEYLSLYAKSKMLAEKKVLAANGQGMQTLSLRPHLIWGPGDNHILPRLLARHREKKLKIIGRGDNLVDIIYVENAAYAHCLALSAMKKNPELGGKSYFIGQERPVNLWQFINKMLELSGEKPVTTMVPENLAYGVGALLEKIYRGFNIRKEPMMTRFVAKQMSTSHYFDQSGAKKDLGYMPRWSIEKGLEQTFR